MRRQFGASTRTGIPTMVLHLLEVSGQLGVIGIGAVSIWNGIRGLLGKDMSTLSTGVTMRLGTISPPPQIVKGTRWSGVAYVIMGLFLFAVGAYWLYQASV